MDSAQPLRIPTDVSVVICAYSDERFADLAAAVASLEQQTLRPLEIIVAVDHNPALLDRVRRELPQVIAVANLGPRGAGVARNAGVTASRGEIIAFLDDDAEAYPEWLEQLLPAFADSSVLGAGGSIEAVWQTARPAWFPPEFDWVVGCTYRGLPSETAPVRNVIAANMAVRRSVFEALGGFRSDFGKQGKRSEPEETEFCVRAQRRFPRGRWMFVPGARVGHHLSAERETFAYFVTRCANEGRGKARMRSLGPAAEKLDTELSYVTRTLPAGVRDGLSRGLRGERGGFGRAAAIVAGLGITAVHYLIESRSY